MARGLRTGSARNNRCMAGRHAMHVSAVQAPLKPVEPIPKQPRGQVPMRPLVLGEPFPVTGAGPARVNASPPASASRPLPRQQTAGSAPPGSSNGNGSTSTYKVGSNGNGYSNGKSYPALVTTDVEVLDVRTADSGSNGSSTRVASGSSIGTKYSTNGSSTSTINSVGRNGVSSVVSPRADTVVAAPVASSSSSRGYSGVTSSSSAATFTDISSSSSSSSSSSFIGAEGPDDMADRPSELDFKWSQDSYNSTWRTLDTWSFFLTFRTRLALLDQKWSYIGGFTEDKKTERTRSLARYLLNSVLQLGPTFIKVGQLSSTRSDLFPAAFIDELSTLQDRVPAFTADKAIRIIEADLGQPIDKLFKTFDRRPIAAASLGQVHCAELWTGERVVVKVQRPGLKQLFDIDLENLRLLAEQLDRLDENSDFKGIYEECASVLYQEIDYINEGRNADRFRRNFASTSWVRVPTVFWEFTSPRVLTLSYMPGVKISDKAALISGGLAVDVVARRATEAYLMQILKHAFFHADPHPGNLAVDRSGNLVFYDFGMMGFIVPDVRERLTDVFYGVYKKDTGLVIKALVDLKIIKARGGDMLSVRRSINFLLENLARQTERDEAISVIGEDLFDIAVGQPFRFPATFTFVLRAFSTLEGIGKGLDPEYRFSTIAQPFATELLSAKEGETVQSALLSQVQQQAAAMGSAALSVPSRVQRIDATLAQLEAGELKLRVRVLEAERAALRSSVLQLATINSIGAVGMMNMGTMLALSHVDGAAALCLTLSGVFGVLTVLGFKRVARLDKFEKDMRA